jgi:hypothetical protein
MYDVYKTVRQICQRVMTTTGQLDMSSSCPLAWLVARRSAAQRSLCAAMAAAVFLAIHDQVRAVTVLGHDRDRLQRLMAQVGRELAQVLARWSLTVCMHIL